MRVKLLWIALSLMFIVSCVRQVPPVILEYPPRAFEGMDSVRMEQRITRHMSGRVEHLYFVYEDSAGNQVQHGPDILYYLDGGKKQVQYFRKGKLWGPATYWHNNGQQQGLSFYTDGKLNGITKSWDENGLLTSVKYWKMGKLHGLQTDYDSQGKVKKQKWWVDNKIVPKPPEVIDTVHRELSDSMRIVTDSQPVIQADSTLPAAYPAFSP